MHLILRVLHRIFNFTIETFPYLSISLTTLLCHCQEYGTAQLGKARVLNAHVLLASQLTGMPWLLPSIIVKYMVIISRVLAQHSTGNLIVTDGPCLTGHRVKKGKDSMYM